MSPVGILSRARTIVVLAVPLVTAAVGSLAGPGPATSEPAPLVLEAKSQPSRTGAMARRDIGTPEELLVSVINHIRRDGENPDLPPLKRTAILDTVALSHSNAMSSADFVAHCNPDTGATPMDRLLAASYWADSAGETLVAGYADPWDLVGALTTSPDNATNLEWYGYREIGVGYVYDGNDLNTVRRDLDGDCTAESTGWGPYDAYWTIVLGRRDDVFPVVINREAVQASTRDVELYLYGEGWASEMRIRNESGTFTAWQPFATDVQWQLTPGAGLREVFVEIRNTSGSVRSASDTITSFDGIISIFEDDFESGNTSAWSAVVG